MDSRYMTPPYIASREPFPAKRTVIGQDSRICNQKVVSYIPRCMWATYETAHASFCVQPSRMISSIRRTCTRRDLNSAHL